MSTVRTGVGPPPPRPARPRHSRYWSTITLAEEAILGQSGTVYFDTASRRLYRYDGSAWTALPSNEEVRLAWERSTEQVRRAFDELATATGKLVAQLAAVMKGSA